ncbi:MAG: TCR/Tet family MFS transporter [Chloroflexi bacterium]|nr:TCR/Tet family MFS transporter [Chloroflexota bacterium]
MNRNLLILFATLVIVLIGFGIIIPILPFYVEEFGGTGITMGLLMSIFAIMQFIFSPMWGSLSDRYGRKPILLIGIFGYAITMLLLGLSKSLWMLFAARGLAGVLSSATLPTAMAYIGDSTSEENRGAGMGTIGAAMGLGMVLGPGIGGTMSKISLQTPFFFATALALAALALIWIYLPESLPHENRDRVSRIRGPQFGPMWKALFGPLGFLLISAFMISFAMTNFEGIYAYYTNIRYDYDAQTVGLILTVVGLTSAVAQGFLTGPLTRKWGEVRVVKASLIGSAIGFLLMLTARTLATVMLTTSIFILSNAMLRPVVSALISKRTTQGQGIAMGLNNAYMSLGRVIGPAVAGVLLDINLSYPFIIGAVIMFIGFVASLAYLRDAVGSVDMEPISAD